MGIETSPRTAMWSSAQRVEVMITALIGLMSMHHQELLLCMRRLSLRTLRLTASLMVSLDWESLAWDHTMPDKALPDHDADEVEYI